ncbi:TonB-dependent receptor [Croceicoccus mobilis]|uniref:TonB-dependent receptor n=2 Tax=Croceicoccus mobilis TaxID=1703339 RepID=A0A916YYK8_9SPHN|nr:TonB-dependent receptor [Croceicoccus mobilis]
MGLLSATMLAGCTLATQAQAQDAATTDTEAQSLDGTIVVTGTRRSTTIQDTPINISAIGAEELASQRIEDVRDIADFTPGMTVLDTGPGSTGNIILRGLSASDTGDFGSNYNNSLGVYLGEVPLYYDFKLIDIDRVETLLGPQGTLYGLGTLAGAIRYIPNRPNTDTIEMAGHARGYAMSHSDDFGYQVDGMINLPIVRDHIAFRSATGYYSEAGFMDYPLLVQEPGISLTQPSGTETVTAEDYADNLTFAKDLNYEKTFTSRNQLLFQTTEDLQLILTYAYQRTKTGGAQSNSAGVLETGKYENASRFVEPATRQAHLASAEVNASVGGIFDIVATGAYTKVKTEAEGDVTDLLLDLDYGYELYPAFAAWNESETSRKQVNAEVRFVSTHGGPFSWVLGGFYNRNKYQSDYAEHTPNHPWVDTESNPEALEYVSFVTSKVIEKAVFGEATLQPVDFWQVTAGARYFDYTSEIAGAATLPLLGQPLSPYDRTASGGKGGQDGWVWKFNSSIDLTDDLMVYGTYSKGYRIGGPNRVAPCDADIPEDPTQYDGPQVICALPSEIQYGPDTTKNIEIGVRSQLFDRKLTLNFNVFKVDWKGLQVASATTYGVTGITVNAGAAESKGFEGSFQLRPVPQFSIQGTYSYTDAKLTEDVSGIIAVNDPAGSYPSSPIKLDALKGDRLPGSPKNSGTLGATYIYQLPDADITANWTAVYRGNVVTRLGYDRAYGDKLPSFVTHRASLSYDTDKFSVGLFADNIFDKYAVVSVANDRSRTGLNDGTLLRYYRQVVLTPRTVGIEARVKY